MGRLIRCECGKVVRGENDEALLEQAERHVQDDHPELAERIGSAELLAMAEDD